MTREDPVRAVLQEVWEHWPTNFFSEELLNRVEAALAASYVDREVAVTGGVALRGPIAASPADGAGVDVERLYQRRLPYSFTSEQMRAIRDAAVDWLDTNQYGTQLACERRLRAALVASPADGAGVDVDELRAALRKEMGWSDHEVTEFLTDHGLAALEGASDGKERP